ncbi:hypothetical protein ANTRET_LOCUS10038 [Anthophora retusa]
MPVATPLLRRPAPPTTKPPLVFQLAYREGGRRWREKKKTEKKKKRDDERMRARFTIRHRVMCARSCVRRRIRRSRGDERGYGGRVRGRGEVVTAQRKISGVSGEEKKD